ncbi:putative HNH endonuclease [Xylophilus phage Lumi]|nr:putative HNH endonuclease [Xylophilus phage Lumi]
MTLTLERVRTLLAYDPLSGDLTWLISTNRRIIVGDVAGSDYHNPSGKSYRQIKIDGKRYIGHRVIWFHQTGDWPEVVDHKDGDGLNNRWLNLRNVDDSGNKQNRRECDSDSKTGFLGVTKHRKRFVAQITTNNKKKYLGTFDTPEEAHECYLKAKRELHSTCTI